MNITQEDIRLILQKSIDSHLKIEVLKDDGTILGIIYGTVSGNMSIDSTSNTRRTCSFIVEPTRFEKLDPSESSFIWYNKSIVLSIGIRNQRTQGFHYYKLGYFIYLNTNSTYDAITNQLSVECADYTVRLDGTLGGETCEQITQFPAYEADEETGEALKYNIIRDVVIKILTQMCQINNYMIDDIGEYKAMPEYNPDWQKYREENSLWNAVPYDKDFSCGTDLFTILSFFRDLYPNYEMFFEPENNTFVCQMIPSCYEDDILFDNDFFERILIDENISVDLTTIRNICKVFGMSIENDFYTEDCKYQNNVYICNVDQYDEYYNGDIIAIKIDKTNLAAPKLNINSYGTIGIYDEDTEEPLPANILTAETALLFKIRKQRINKEDVIKAFYLGQWQPIGMDVLTDGSKSKETYTTTDGTVLEKYSKEYFQTLYNCRNVQLTIVANSPFTVQKLGERPTTKSGGEFENITSDSLALQRAHWENWKNCRMTDSITITTLLVPFLDVNIKVSYRPQNSETPQQYIITSISHDFTAWTTTITMYRFYPLYEQLLKEAGTHKVLAENSHGILSKYTHEQLTTVISGEEL